MHKKLSLVCCVFLLFASNAFAVTVNLPPATKSVIAFSKQIRSVETIDSAAKNSVGITYTIGNHEFGGGVLFLTLNENYTTGTLHIWFEDGEIETLEIYADPTASSQVDLRTGNPRAELQKGIMNLLVDSNKGYVETPTYSVPTKASKEANSIVYLLNNLENADKVWLRYEKPLPQGLKANVSRVLNYNNNLLYEVEIRNETNEMVNLEAAMLADYLTNAVAIAGMNQYGMYLMKPNEVNFVYISKRAQ